MLRNLFLFVELPVQETYTSVEETLAGLICKTNELNRVNVGADYFRGFEAARKMYMQYRGDISMTDSYIRQLLAFATLYLVFLIALPLGVAVILFNRNKSMDEDAEGPSDSYIFLFITRQFVGLAVAIILQSLTKIIVMGLDAWLSTFKFTNHYSLTPPLLAVGSTLSLFITQAFGRPLVLFYWSIFNKRWVSGPQPSAHHWLHGQDRLDIFNASNPSGNLVENELYLNILNAGLFLSILIFVKRAIVRVNLYRQAFFSYGRKLIQLMKKMIMVRELILLSQPPKTTEQFNNEVNDDSFPNRRRAGALGSDFEDMGDTISINGDSFPHRRRAGALGSDFEDMGDTSSTEQLNDGLNDYRHPKRRTKEVSPEAIKYAIEFHIKDLTVTDQRYDDTSMCALWLFRRAMELMQEVFWMIPAEEVYKDTHAMQRESWTKDFVNFYDTIAYLAVNHEGRLIESKVKELISVFQPNRDGCIPEHDFVRIIRVIYNERQSLRETIHWITHTHRQFEQLINVIFYVAVIITIPFFLGFDHKDLLLPMSAIIATFTFVIGSTCSDYTKGCLFILMRQPYSIGDFIQVNTFENVPFSKEKIYRVTEITLYDTKAVGLSNNVEISLSNGNHYGDQILNWGQSSPKFQIVLEFPGNTKDALFICNSFQKKVHDYIKAHPRAWHPMNVTSLYSVRVEDKDEYRFEIQHRCSWLELDHILECKEQLLDYCKNVDVAEVRAPGSSSTFQIDVR